MLNEASNRTLFNNMEKIKCIVVDDDPVAREMLRQIIGQNNRLKLMGLYGNAIEAKMAMVKNELDLVFLDVEMPEMSGFELLDSYKDIPQVVMVSENTQYAFEAFEYDVTDFLSKPLDLARFERAINKVEIFAQNLAGNNEELNIVIKSNGVLVKLSTNSIDYVEAMGDYIKVVSGDDSYVVHSTMKAFIAQLPFNFLRTHKSYIVNMEKILEMDDSHVVGEYFNLPVSRSYKSDIKSKFKEFL